MSINTNMELLGFEITKSKEKKSSSEIKSKEVIENIIPANDNDGAFVVGGSWNTVWGTGNDTPGSALSDESLILQYRQAAEYPECDTAVNIIVDEAINTADDMTSPVRLEIGESDKFGKKTRESISGEFDKILQAMDFTHNAYDYFRSWYIDGRIYLHIILEGGDSGSIEQVKFIDPFKIRLIKEMEEKTDVASGAKYHVVKSEYFLYMNTDGQFGDTMSLKTSNGNMLTGVKLNTDSVIYVTSGFSDVNGKKVYSYLNKALKQVNQLRKLEDAVVIYRLARAPERRIFYVDVGNLSKNKADALMKDVISKYKNKMVYDAASGNVLTQKDHLSMQEDFWLARKEGGRGTEVSTLPGGDNLGQIEDLVFFQRKLYRSLNVPVGRLEQDNNFSFGRSSEITRDEITLQKFVTKLQRQFSKIFIKCMKIQLIMNKVITEDEWDELKKILSVNFEKDNHFSEMKDAEILEQRMSALEAISEYRGQYFSDIWIRKHILRQTDSEIIEMDKQIDKERKEGKYDEEDDDI